MINHPFLLHRYSESAWLISFDQTIDPTLNEYVHALANYLELALNDHLEINAAYCSIMVNTKDVLQYHALPDKRYLEKLIKSFEPSPFVQNDIGIIEVPVCYDRALGNDLAALSSLHNISPEEIIRLHSERVYQVFMVGFQPGFAYMGIVHERIAFARKARPATTRSGAVGIAGLQTGIYPFDSPGGWQIVGYTPWKMFSLHQDPPTKLMPGTKVRFQPIAIEAYKNLLIV